MKKKTAVLVLMAILVSVLSVWPVMAEGERFDISCEADDSIYIPDDIKDYPIQVKVKNNGGDFEGILKIMLYAGSQTDETIAYGQKAVISAGDTEIFQFNIQDIIFYSQEYSIPVRIDLLDENGNTVYQTVSSFMAGSDGYAEICAGIISRDTRISQGLDATDFEYDGMYYDGYGVAGTITMHGIDLTSDILETMDLSRLEMLVIEENISEDAWRNVSDWLIMGGHMLISRPVYEKLVHKPLDNQQMTSYGTGRIMVYDREAWNGAMLIRSVKTLFGYELGRFIMGRYDVYWQQQRALSYDIHSPIPDVSPYLIVLIIYIIAIGPVGYLFLKKKDRREFLWALIPCIAVIFSVIIYQLSSSTRYTGDFIRYNSQVWLTDEGNVENTSFVLVSPDKGKVIFSADEDSHLSYLKKDSYWYDESEAIEDRQEALLEEDYDVALAASEGKTDVLIHNRVVFNEEYLTSSRVLDAEGTIDCDLECYHGAFSGTITNTTSWNLKNCFVTYKGVVIMIGDLPAGESIRLDQKKVDYIWNNLGMQIAFDTSDYSEMNETAVYQTMNNMFQNAGYAGREQAVIGGFTDEYDIGIEGGQLTFIDGLALITKNIQITDSGDGWKTQMIVYGEGSTLEDRESYDSACYYVYDSEICLDYQLDRDYAVDYLEWLNSDPAMQMAFYNHETGEYDQVFDGTVIMEGDALAPYLNARNLLKVQITIDNMDTEHFVPAFSTSGGERRD